MNNKKKTKYPSFKGIVEIFNALKNGDFKTRLSFIFMGFGNLFNGQIIKGLLFLSSQILYFYYMLTFGNKYIALLPTLGTSTKKEVWVEDLQIYKYTQGDNSMLILLYSVMSLMVTLIFLMLWASNILSAYKVYNLKKTGKPVPKFIKELKALLDINYHKTLLALPVTFVTAFTVLPLVFMILIAFTNFDKLHQPPGNLFTWVGFENFKEVFWKEPVKSYTFRRMFEWTLIWAFFATFTNYIFGMILAMMINKKSIKLKKLWRTVFVVSIAVPQFVTLMLMSKMLDNLGAINVILQSIGITKSAIPFLTNANWARVTVILVNMWVGIPYTMLITTGILMNIPEELYESARIDGAGPARIFMSITLPYMLFVTTPYLITQFIGNINNFNVIYLLTRGDPKTLDYFQGGKTDLLVTWLYKLTVTEQNYSLASTIGILVFIISATLSLIVYNFSGSVKKEDEFA